MSKTLVINDLHLGVQRTGGTTRASADALREWGHQQHRRLLRLAPAHGCDRVIVNGDLSDVYDLPLGQALEIYMAADEFMVSHPDIDLVWALGNHDLSKDSSRLGTVAFVAALLGMKHPDQFQMVSEPTMLEGGVYVVPHLPNQELFDLALSRVPEGEIYILLHCNYDNKFAMQSDGSLNLCRDEAKRLIKGGGTVILGHEHQQNEAFGGKLVVVGNQFPSSISDCLGSGGKRALVIHHE
jgi:Calcineurin-like phosphoesterase